MVPTVPGQMATVLVAFALMDGRPSQISVGNVKQRAAAGDGVDGSGNKGSAERYQRLPEG